jgi:HAD superfamily hydrolase (TIGR01450 family)
MTWVLDLDGVVWLGDEAIAGSAQAIARLRARGERVVLATNNSSMTVAEYQAKLDFFGVPTERDDLVTSAQVAAGLLDRGQTALVCAGPGVVEALTGRGVTPVRQAGTPVDAVVVGWHRDFDYERLTVAMRAVRGGARLIGTNDDATYPMPDGVLPGGGSILAAVAYASGVEPTVAGKPHQPMVDHLRATVGDVDIVVGDRPSTDGLLARGLGARFALVLSGVTRPGDLPVVPAPDQVADRLADLVP